MKSTQLILEEAHDHKLIEIQREQNKLKKLQGDLANLNAKMDGKESLSQEDTKFIGELGWLAALSVAVATVAVSI